MSFQGNGQMYAYEVAAEEPYLFPLATTKFPTASQAFSFLPKYLCDVKEVEFAKAYRLTQTTIEPVSFTVPRVRVRNKMFSSRILHTGKMVAILQRKWKTLVRRLLYSWKLIHNGNFCGNKNSAIRLKVFYFS